MIEVVSMVGATRLEAATSCTTVGECSQMERKTSLSTQVSDQQLQWERQVQRAKQEGNVQSFQGYLKAF